MKISEYIDKTLSDYNAEKMKPLILHRYKPVLNGIGIFNMLILIENDIKIGIDGFTKKPIQKSHIHLMNDEILNFIKCFVDDTSEVEKIIPNRNNLSFW